MRRRLPAEEVLEHLADQGITTFTTADFQRLFRLNPSRAQWKLGDLTRQGVLRRFLHGWYVVSGPAESEVLRQPMFLGTRLLEPSYVAFGTALHFHGWTDRAPKLTYIASPRRSRIRRIGRHPIYPVQLPASRFFGHAPVRMGSLEFDVADPEKAIVDAFYASRHCGGMKAVVSALGNARSSIDLGRLEAYAARMGSRSLCSRLGFVLETLGVEPRSLARHASTVPVSLDPQGPRRGQMVSRWNVIENP